MMIKSIVLDENEELVFQGSTLINPEGLVEVAKSRTELALEKGEEWTRNGIPVFGEELIKKAKLGKLGHDMDKAAMEVALMSWVYESLFLGMDEQTFISCDLVFTMFHDGVVKYDRVPAAV